MSDESGDTILFQARESGHPGNRPRNTATVYAWNMACCPLTCLVPSHHLACWLHRQGMAHNFKRLSAELLCWSTLTGALSQPLRLCHLPHHPINPTGSTPPCHPEFPSRYNGRFARFADRTRNTFEKHFRSESVSASMCWTVKADTIEKQVARCNHPQCR